MLVRHYNTDLKGGAATAARRLHGSLLESNFDSIFHYQSDYHDDQVTATKRETFQQLGLIPPQGVESFLRKCRIKKRKRDNRRYFFHRPSGYEIFSVPWEVVKTPYGVELPCDIVHLHWISSWIDLKSFFESYPMEQVFVWTIHDMNTITGGCHHADQCEKFKTICRACPQVDHSGWRDISYRGFVYKKRLFRNRKLHIVTPSRWMENNVRSSALGKYAASVRTIRNGLDLTLFQPMEKNEARIKLGIPADRPVLGFGAASIRNERKGFQDLIRCLKILAEDECRLPWQILMFGMDDTELPSIPGIEFHSQGYLATPELQATAYSAMDLFILPSWAENMPQTAVEAMACGAPVVAYDIGGLPEIVIPEKTGLLAKHREPVDLARQIKMAMLNFDSLTNWSRAGRELVLKEFALKTTCKQYTDLYRSIN